MGDQPESINVQRRRKSGGISGRAEAPVRRGSSPRGGFSSGGPGSGGGGLPVSGGKLGGCGGILLIVVFVIYYLLSGGAGDDLLSEGGTGNDPQQSAQTLPTNTPRPTRVPSAEQSGQTWLVMLYQDGDDQVLEQDIFLDLNEAEKVGSSERVTIVTQFDRFRGGFNGDGNWASTRRYLVTQDDDLNAINSQMVADLGEASMSEGQSLVDFVTWSISQYPADRFVLILSDHGMGWPGGWSDPAPGTRDPGRAPLIGALDGDHLFLSEIDEALGQIRQQTGLEKFDIIGMDACLMSQLEVYAALQPHARFAIASEETEPALGWAYASFLQTLTDNPDMGADQLAAAVVQSYIAQDERIVDNQARAEFLRQGSPMGGFFGESTVSAAQLTRQLERNITLTAVDLETFPNLMQRYNEFAYALQNEDQATVASARNYAQSYTSIFGKEVPASFIDLGHFAQLVAQKSDSSALTKPVDNLMAALNQAIVAEKHGSAKPGSTGIAIYFPNSTLYRSPYTGMQSYTQIADRFAQESLWDDFLVYHYNDRPFKLADAGPVSADSSSPARVPGSGNVSISAISASTNSIEPEETVTLSAEISGSNIGYIYLLIGFYDPQSKSIFVADTDFLESAQTQSVGGAYYPRWPDKNFVMNYEGTQACSQFRTAQPAAWPCLPPKAMALPLKMPSTRWKELTLLPIAQNHVMPSCFSRTQN
ncbi:MAG: clostripain-related cysteine peptidase [Anaerolineales bacterium]|jgi:hypothetical protein|nr:clostripain-related cysteine peptidase [Anaerolineales bacterium]